MKKLIDWANDPWSGVQKVGMGILLSINIGCTIYAFIINSPSKIILLVCAVLGLGTYIFSLRAKPRRES